MRTVCVVPGKETENKSTEEEKMKEMTMKQGHGAGATGRITLADA